MDIQKNLLIIKKLNKSSLYKSINDNLISLIFYFFIIVIILFSILYYIYQHYFIKEMNYSSYLNLENIEDITYNKNLKVAIILTGNVQHISTLISQKYFIYDKLNPDIFCYFNETTDKMKDDIIKLLNPIETLFDENPDIEFDDYKKVMKLNEIRKIYENKKNIDHKNQFSKSTYNVIIRIRGDLYVKNPIPNKIVNNLNSNSIYIPTNEKSSNYYSLEIGVNDYFSICTPEIFDVYANFYNYLINENTNITCNIVEYLLKKYLVISKITVNEFTYDTILYKLRTNQINYIYMYIKQYFKKLGNKFHCIID